MQQGQTVRAVRLVQLMFASETKRVHQGAGPIRTADPNFPLGTPVPPVVWSGLGELGQISDIDRSLVPTSGSPFTLSLSGVDPGLIPKTLAASSETKGRPVQLFDQNYDESLAPLDKPYAVAVALMDRMILQDDGATAIISVNTVTLLYNRRRPAFGYLNAASQRRLYPNDGGADQLSRLVQATERWPAY